ncbi:hypothetical protein [Blastopirellula marina]|uniref:Uncharacterized protein n=1 Tax=Blastopirellula marina TaxID=124 RepID=A0A2S8G1G5_9BACT|nr:hypothetical protein [Blastopirellula marina]PQO38287.1 hypothetical protein C5Y98_09470 [Blastopirellula marina]PTL44943.1 hypothetical protein C5Y97_09475 [Blastopirellula marina]
MDELQGIPDLLHDASLQGLQWQSHDRTLRVFFDCLRRAVDDSDSADTPVELRLTNVSQFAFFYSPASDAVRPSEIDFQARFASPDLAPWDGRSSEAFLYVNSQLAEIEWETAAHRLWIFQADDNPASKLRVAISLSPVSYGEDSIKESLFVLCDAIEPMSGGHPLSLEKWNEQYRAWWEGWSEHWEERSDDEEDDDDLDEDDDEQRSYEYEIAIPAETSDLDPLDYSPPQKPAFQITATDAPVELLKPIEDYHTGMLERDWRKVRSASPRLDDSEELTEEELEESYLDDGRGSWSYIRQVDSWWREGRRACVVVRGMEHTMPDEEDPAENRETVITYGLREFEGRWIIWSSTQGWPDFGSAPELYEEPGWKKEWD